MLSLTLSQLMRSAALASFFPRMAKTHKMYNLPEVKGAGISKQAVQNRPEPTSYRIADVRWCSDPVFSGVWHNECKTYFVCSGWPSGPWVNSQNRCSGCEVGVGSTVKHMANSSMWLANNLPCTIFFFFLEKQIFFSPWIDHILISDLDHVDYPDFSESNL